MQSSNRTHVVHIITTLSAGGATENTLLSVIGLRELGCYDVTLLGGSPLESEGGLIEMAERANVDYEIVPTMSRDIDIVADTQAFQYLMRRLKELNCDIIHTHTAKAGILGRLAGILLGVPVVTHTFHGFPFPEEAPYHIRAMHDLSERIAARWSHGILSVSREMIHRAVRTRIATPGLCTVARSGMDLSRYLATTTADQELRASWGVPEDGVALGVIGRVYANHKGQDRLVRLAPRLVQSVPNLHIVAVGAGPSVDELKEEATKLGVTDHVHFVGSYPHDRMPEVISSLDIVALLSEHEGLARVVVQALACRRPVISWNRDGSPEVITDRYNGRLIESFNDEALVDAIVELAANPDLRKTWGERGPAAVDPEWRNENMVRQIHENYRAMLKRVGLTAPPPIEVPPYETWNMG